MRLSIEQADLLRAVTNLQGPPEEDDPAGRPTTIPGTKAVGEAMLAMWQARGGGYSFHSSPPWNGTSPYIHNLRDAGYIEVEVGMARIGHRDRPAESASQYFLELTSAGRDALLQYDEASH